MQTSLKQISLFTKEELTFSLEDFPASPTQAPENDSERRTNAIYGPKCLEQFERFSRVGLWAKTFSALLIGTGDWYSRRCRLTWKLKGTKYNRLYFRLQASTLPTEEIEFGLLPTPRANKVNGLDLNNEKLAQRNKSNLEEEVAKWVTSGLLPTPQASEGKKIAGKENQDSLTKRARMITGKTSQLNPRFVAEMMGFPPNWTELPFQNGETNPLKPMEMP